MAKKRKKQKYIKKIISDGKISAKEAKKAVKKGISLRRIQNAQTKSYKEGSPYYVAPTIKGGRGPMQIGGQVQERPYRNLQMKGKVRSIFDTPVAAAPEETTAPETETQEQPLTSDYVEEAETTLDEADTRFEDLLNQFKIFQQAAEERNRLAREAQRQQMLTMQRRERAAGRAPSLHLRGAGEFGKAGSQGFRRRANQFRINPFRNLGGVMGAVGNTAQGIVNKMVNI
tara:strand:- start:83 stop:769 length:687 start_codon:yes stop_codon:yes gene_type:complete